MRMPIVGESHISATAYGPTAPPLTLDRAKMLVRAVAAIFSSSGMGELNIDAYNDEGGNSAICGNERFVIVAHDENNASDNRTVIEIHTLVKEVIGDMQERNSNLMILFMRFPDVVSTIVEMVDRVEVGDNSPKVFAIPLDFGNRQVTKGRSVEEVLSALSEMNVAESTNKRDLN